MRVVENFRIGILTNSSEKFSVNFLAHGFPGIFKCEVPLDKIISLEVHNTGTLNIQPSSFIYREIPVAVLPLVISDTGIREESNKSPNFNEEFGVMQFSEEFYNEFPKQLKRLFYFALSLFFFGAGIVCIQDMAPSRRGGSSSNDSSLTRSDNRAIEGGCNLLGMAQA
jgi:hypothetical protein